MELSNVEIKQISDSELLDYDSVLTFYNRQGCDYDNKVEFIKGLIEYLDPFN